MLTNTRVASAVIWPLVVMLAVVVVLALAVRTGVLPGLGATELPPDVLALGTDVTSAAPEGKILAQEAAAAFERAWGSTEGGKIETYLVTMTDASVTIEARDVWVVKLSGVPVPFSIPDVPMGVPRPSATAGDVLYSYVDAVTGEWLVARTPP